MTAYNPVPLPAQMRHQISKNDEKEDDMKDNEKEAKNGADEKEEEEEETEKSAASGLTQDELSKSLDKLENVLKSTPEGRKQELFQKGMEGKLSDAENAELMSLMSGKQDDGLSANVSKSLDPAEQSEGFQKSINVSEFLDDLYSGVSTSIQHVADFIEKSDSRRQEQTVVLAKGILDIGRASSEAFRMMKSLDEKLELLLQQPAHAPRSVVRTSQVVEKSLGAPAQPQRTRISKPEVLDILTAMNMESPTGLAKCGERLDLAISNYEQFDDMPEPLAREVMERYNGAR